MQVQVKNPSYNEATNEKTVEVYHYVRLRGRFLLCCIINQHPEEDGYLDEEQDHLIIETQELATDFRLFELSESGEIKDEALLFTKSCLPSDYFVTNIEFDDSHIVVLYEKLGGWDQQHCEIRDFSTGALLVDVVTEEYSDYETIVKNRMIFSSGFLFIPRFKYGSTMWK